MKSFIFRQNPRKQQQEQNNLVDYSDSDDDEECNDDIFVNNEIIINVSEKSSKDYGLFIWDGSLVLSWYLFTLTKNNPQFWNGKNVLELNAGVALPSILLSKLGVNKIIITDRIDGFIEIQNNIIDNLNLNGFNINNNNNINDNKIFIEPLSWGNFEKFSNQLTSSSIDYLITSDCFYDNTKNYDDIFATWYYFLLKNDKLVILLTYQVRCNEKTIFNYLKKWKLKSEILSIKDISIPNYNIDSEIILIKITKNQ
ncbi:hypothetical protein DDB_G0287111 [Dictyostelium discoideum AX4]|uniref:Methyltransferase-like protein 23 n=1 Tax=Dictyostelium discoideum TaxID=44689 RepID=MET23_DICDI|nr:hypothetical protein DDB_G0287111 [Dictyostelium discoideum AX4]Q54KW9.1 RecName: Full=Methyltransferase-like protein 23 [Dictyostelium discoideum]EAL63920.1 hypothetical protein DDB_G0287111 [Dictyostelium discoideum AX4]|eukprot:XP_637401.1 hypothetical protein DDB_G0287111 [Dictyostelium discoideum AX4]